MFDKVPIPILIVPQCPLYGIQFGWCFFRQVTVSPRWVRRHGSPFPSGKYRGRGQIFLSNWQMPVIITLVA